jgi:hypothetical protein
MGYSAPMANFDHALVYSKSISIWGVVDDLVVEKENAVLARECMKTIASENDNHFEGWTKVFKSLGDDYAR